MPCNAADAVKSARPKGELFGILHLAVNTLHLKNDLHVAGLKNETQQFHCDSWVSFLNPAYSSWDEQSKSVNYFCGYMKGANFLM